MKRAALAGFTAGLALAAGFIAGVVFAGLVEDDRLTGGAR